MNGSRVTTEHPLGRFQQLVGLRTQSAIAALASRADPRPSRAAVGRVVAELLAGAPLPHDRRRGYQLIASMTWAYFQSFMLPPEWRLVGTEVPLAGGRVDLWWESNARRVVIDELKAGRGRERPDPDDEDQARRYVASGAAALGPRLVAVRLIVLGPPTRGFLFRPGQTPLVATPIAGLGGRML